MAEAKVDTPSSAWLAMMKMAKLPEALLTGTQGMRDGGETWLPKYPRENHMAYRRRVQRSFLHPAYAHTIRRLSAKPFSRTVTLLNAEGVPARIQPIEKNADGCGTSLTQFAKEVLFSAIHFGITHVFVDFAANPEPLRRDQMLKKIKAGESFDHPYFVHLQMPDLFAWRSEKAPGGDKRLTEIRYFQNRIEQDGLYGEKSVDLIRRVTPDGWELFRKDDRDGEYHAVPNDKGGVGTYSFPGIPLITIYTKRTGFMQAEPSMLELAETNLEHYQALSDYNNYMAFASIGIHVASGFSPQEKKDLKEWGPGQIVVSSNEKAKMTGVDHGATAAAAGRTRIQDIEARMETMGLQPILRMRQNQTATGQSLDASATNFDMRSAVRAVEVGLSSAYGMATTWVKEKLPAEFGVDIFDDFDLKVGDVAEAEVLLRAVESGKIDTRTYLEEMKSRRLIAEGTDIEDVLKRVRREELFRAGIVDSSEVDEISGALT